jgi:hypothetical protein
MMRMEILSGTRLLPATTQSQTLIVQSRTSTGNTTTNLLKGRKELGNLKSRLLI